LFSFNLHLTSWSFFSGISSSDSSASDRYLWSPITRQGKRYILLLGGCLAGLLPLFQAHGYVGVGFVAGWFAVFEFLRDILVLLLETLVSSPRISLPLFLRSLLSRFLPSSSCPTSSFSSSSGGAGKRKKWSWKQIYEGWIGKNIIDWLFFFATLLLVSAPQVPLFVSRVQSTGGFLSQGTWIFRGNSLSACFNFWFHALHYCLHFSVLALLGMNFRMQRIYIGFIFLFVLSNYVQFQPWAKDNIKMIYIWLFASSGATGNLAVTFYSLLDRLLCVTYALALKLLARSSSPSSPSFRQLLFSIITTNSSPSSTSSSSFSSSFNVEHLVKTCIRVLFVMWIGYQLFFLIFTGALTAAKESQLDYRFYGTDEMATGLFVRENTPPTAIFLTSSQHINPITCIGGRQQLYGYGGWMWSHGLSSISGPRQGTASASLLRCHREPTPPPSLSASSDSPESPYSPSPPFGPSPQTLRALNDLKVEYVVFDLDMKEEPHVSCVSSYAVKVFQSYPIGYFSVWKVHPKFLKWKTTYENPEYPWDTIIVNE
jgi:hypothetical protein